MTQTVIENIRMRSKEIKKRIKSKITTGLVVQGGAMRGIYSMAALMPLEECGLREAFDHIIGSSAGAINGTYLLSGQAKDGVCAYLDDISNKNFINFARLQKIVDIDFLVDEVVKKKKALKVNRVRNAYTTMHIILTDYLTGEAAVVTNKDRKVDLIEAIRATSAIPILYNKVVMVKGRGYIDGGLIDGIPLLRAIELGCTDIIVVITRQPNFRRQRPNLFMRLIEKPFLWKYPKATKKLVLSENKLFNRTMDLIENPSNISNGVRISVIYPSEPNKLVSRTTSNRDKLLACALMARNDTRKLLNLKPLNDNPFT